MTPDNKTALIAQLNGEAAAPGTAPGERVISATQRRALKAEAHSLHPLVTIADNGLSPAVLKEIDHSLKVHGLIKIRVVSDDREQRAAYLNDICTALNAAAVQHIGKLLVVWRPKVETQSDKSGKASGRRKTPRPLKRSFQND